MNNLEILLSLVIPVYNVQPYLKRCLDSCLMQDFDAYEIICVDDGSTDGSGKELDDYQRRFPQLIRVFHTENQGVSEARNKGIQESRGAYIWFIDPDDIIAENILGAIDDRIKGLDLLILPHQIEYENQKDLQIKRANLEMRRETEFKNYAKNNSFDKVWNYIVKKEILEQNGLRFGKNIVLAEDRAFDFFLKEHITAWDVYDKIAYRYIIRKASASKGHVHNDEYIKRMIENAYWTAIYLEETISRYDDPSFIENAKRYLYENVREVISLGIRLGKVNYLNEKIDQMKERSLYPVSFSMLKRFNTFSSQGIKDVLLNYRVVAICLCRIYGAIRRK